MPREKFTNLPLEQLEVNDKIHCYKTGTTLIINELDPDTELPVSIVFFDEEGRNIGVDLYKWEINVLLAYCEVWRDK